MEAYFDNSATTKVLDCVKDAVVDAMCVNYGNAAAKHRKGVEAENLIREAKKAIADTLKVQEKEILFTSGGTESDNWAIKGLMRPGDTRQILTSQIEHHAVLNACLSIERMGFPVRRLPVNREGIVESESFQTSISDQTKIASVMLANNEIGTVEPVSALAEIAHQHGALFHTDAVQAVGHIPVDVKALGVDLLSASGHKFNGPKGVGFLYIKKGTEIQPYADGGGQESGIRAGTENIASIVAMACALRKNCDRMITVSERLSRMEHIFIHTLNQAGIDYIRNGAGNHIPGNINISIRNANGESLLHRLDLKGICISTGSACDSVNTQVSHVIQAIGIPKEYAQGTIRISFGADNIETDASEVATALIEILRK